MFISDKTQIVNKWHGLATILFYIEVQEDVCQEILDNETALQWPCHCLFKGRSSNRSKGIIKASWISTSQAMKP